MAGGSGSSLTRPIVDLLDANGEVMTTGGMESINAQKFGWPGRHRFAHFVGVCGFIVGTVLGTSCAVVPKGGRFVFAETVPLATASATDVSDAARAERRFACDLWAALREQPEAKNLDIVVSPLTLQHSLFTATLGARSSTAEALERMLHRGPIGESAYRGLSALMSRLSAQTTADRRTEVATFGGLFLQKGLTVESDYLERARRLVGAGVRLLDFAEKPEASLASINGYFAESATRYLIKDLVAPSVVTKNTRLIIADTLRLSMTFALPFLPSRAESVAFTRFDGRVDTRHAMSHGPVDLPYARVDGSHVLSLPSEDARLLLTLVVPDIGQFDRVEASLTEEKLGILFGAQKHANLTLRLSPFSMHNPISLKTTLASLGAISAFQETADFRGIVRENVWIDDVIHETYLALDEWGLNTTPHVVPPNPPPKVEGPSIEITVDRPFLFWVHDPTSGTILLNGRRVR